jgi:hypothetical protein
MYIGQEEEDYSYYNDSRVQAGRQDKPDFDEQDMTITLPVLDEDDEETGETLAFPAKYEVCGTCNGKGTHVNPSIDCCGLTSEDFEDDPDFRENYMSGTYDVQCYECHGKRVVPEIDESKLSDKQKEVLKQWRHKKEYDYQYARESAAERRMGY